LIIYDNYNFGNLSFFSIAFCTVLSKFKRTSIALSLQACVLAVKTVSSSAENSPDALFLITHSATEKTSVLAFFSRLLDRRPHWFHV